MLNNCTEIRVYKLPENYELGIMQDIFRIWMGVCGK